MASGQRKITLKDIAKECGLSPSSVGYILSENRNFKFKEETCKLVRETASRLNYRPNLAAKALSMQRQFAVGVLMLNGGNFYNVLSNSIQRQLLKEGYIGLSAFWDTKQELDQEVNNLLARGVDGFISVEYSELMGKGNIPYILYSSRREELNRVGRDDKYSMEESIRYLTELGHQKIGYIGNIETPMFEAFKAQIFDSGLKTNPAWHQNANMKSVASATRQMLTGDNHPTAIVCAADIIALGVISTAAQDGWKIPEDISIIGMDNLPESSFFNPPLTTFDAEVPEIARQLVKLLLKQIENSDNLIETVTIKPQLIIRKSCAPCRSE